VAQGGRAERQRLASLDVLRGLTIVGMIVVNSASYLYYVSGYAIFARLEHAAWRGFTIADSVFPAFVFMTGVSIPLALASGRRRSWTARRCAVSWFDPDACSCWA
jgi:predicted acyltransferase